MERRFDQGLVCLLRNLAANYLEMESEAESIVYD